MKVRALRNVFDTDLDFEFFKLQEFSKSLTSWVPDLELSCSECSDQGNEIDIDTPFSFLIKFKADKLSAPQEITEEGVAGIFLPKYDGLNYVKDEGEHSFFKSIPPNHFNLKLDERSLLRIAEEVFGQENKRFYFNEGIVGGYLLRNYKEPEWSNLFQHAKKKNWKKYLKELLKKQFISKYCNLKKSDLLAASQLDDAGVKASLLELNQYGCLIGVEINEVRQAFGATFI